MARHTRVKNIGSEVAVTIEDNHIKLMSLEDDSVLCLSVDAYFSLGDYVQQHWARLI